MNRARTRRTWVSRLFGSRESTFFSAAHPSAQQRAIREILQARRNLSANSDAALYLRIAERMYLEGDYEQARKRAVDSIHYSMAYASRSRARSR